MSSHVTQVQREVAGEGVLDTQGPIHDVGRDIFRVYRHHVALLGDGKATEPGARGEDGASPVEVRGTDSGGAEVDGAAKGLPTHPGTSLSDRYVLVAGGCRDAGQGATSEVIWA